MTCNCSAPAFTLYRDRALDVNLRNDTFQGRPHLVVPVVMLRQTVVNRALVEINELQPEAWNGVPVTVGHPVDKDGREVSANSPTVLEQWAVGSIFNARMSGDKLLAEAWLDVARAERIGHGDVIKAIQAGEPMDVSTGYFALHVKEAGIFNGKTYVEKHKDIKPDHLALLPNAEGACNWKDGCGIRDAHKKGLIMNLVTLKSGLQQIFTALGLTVNLEGPPMDKKQLIDLLVNKKVAQESERTSLETLSEATLQAMVANAELPPNMPGGKKGQEEDDDKKKKTTPVPPTTQQQQQLPVVANLSAEDRAALDFAKNHVATHRKTLVDKIVANSDMKVEVLNTMDLSVLESIAAGLRPVADYSARGGNSPVQNAGEADKEVAESMAGPVLNFTRKTGAN
jgi:hypothetical protein